LLAECIKKFNLTQKIEAENEAMKAGNACKYVIEAGDEKVL